MKKISQIVLLVLVVCVVAAVIAPGLAKKNYGWRYKMSVTVETPEGIVTGSAVRQMGNDTQGPLIPEAGNPADVRGEAVVVDLGKRGVLFALISSDSDMEFYNAYRHLWPGGGSTPEGIKFYANMPIGTKGTIVPEYPPGYPMLVTFTDIKDPKTATQAQLWTRRQNGLFTLTEDRMEELFGSGVKLKDITLEITDEPVTWGVVDRYLPWLKMFYGKRLDGNRYGTIEATHKTANAIGAGSFSTGVKK